MTAPATPPGRDTAWHAGQAAHYLLVAHNTRAAAAEYLLSVTPLTPDEVDEVVDALFAAPNLLSALAGTPRPASAAVEVAYCPESGMVHRRLDDRRWHVLDVVPGDDGAPEPPAGSLPLGHVDTEGVIGDGA